VFTEKGYRGRREEAVEEEEGRRKRGRGPILQSMCRLPIASCGLKTVRGERERWRRKEGEGQERGG
jgi:hypothetical protein